MLEVYDEFGDKIFIEVFYSSILTIEVISSIKSFPSSGSN
jgi:hypothetical protein